MELKQHQQSGSIKSDWANSSVYKITHKGGTEHMEKNNSKMEKKHKQKNQGANTQQSVFFGRIDAGWMDTWIDRWMKDGSMDGQIDRQIDRWKD